MGYLSEIDTVMKNIDILIPDEETSIYNRCVSFHQRFDDEGLLISQYYLHLRLDSDEETYDDFLISRPEMDNHKGRMLYHVTRRCNIPSIRAQGLIPSKGDWYTGHWRGHHKGGEVGRLLVPGVFLLQNKRICKPQRGYATCKIPFDKLNPKFIYIDHAWRNEQAIFYTDVIPPEWITITR